MSKRELFKCPKGVDEWLVAFMDHAHGCLTKFTLSFQNQATSDAAGAEAAEHRLAHTPMISGAVVKQDDVQPRMAPRTLQDFKT